VIRTPTQQNSGISHSVIDMTPLVDIVFIMIVFLILCINQPITALPFELPTSGVSETTAQSLNETTIMLFDAPPYYGIEQARYEDVNKLITTLLLDAPADQHQIQIASDANTPVQALLELLEQLKASDFKTSNILMEKQ
jgi:biopolymer transport protein ExbD